MVHGPSHMYRVTWVVGVPSRDSAREAEADAVEWVDQAVAPCCRGIVVEIDKCGAHNECQPDPPPAPKEGSGRSSSCKVIDQYHRALSLSKT